MKLSLIVDEQSKSKPSMSTDLTDAKKDKIFQDLEPGRNMEVRLRDR